VRRVRRDGLAGSGFDLLALTEGDLERLEEMAHDPRMSVMCSLYRSNRLTALVRTVPAVVEVLGDRLSDEVTEFWRITPRTDIAQSVNYCSRLGIYRRLYGAGTQILTAHEPVQLDGDTLFLRNVFNGAQHTIENVSLVVYSTPRAVEDQSDWSASGAPAARIGDCVSPRDLMSAIHEGHAAGNAV